MKRSEFIKLMEIKLENLIPYYNDNHEKILTVLEQLGLKPPETKNSNIRTMNDTYCAIRCSCVNCDPDLMVNEWEPE